jgi:hypothetical protein
MAMKKLVFALLFISLNLSAAAFNPTNFTGTKDEVRDLFSKLWGDFKDYDNFHCYRRAHILSYQMSKMNINSMKVFFFKGDSMRMPMDWYYHVAPMIYYHGEGVVMDKGLFKGATTLVDWLDAFGEGKKCLEVASMDEYRANVKTQNCLYMIVPMYYYGPLSLEELKTEAFDGVELSDMLMSLPRRQRDDYLELYPIP